MVQRSRISTGRGARSSKDGDLIAAIDIGSSRAVCLIAYLIPTADGEWAPEIIGVGRQGGALRERGASHSFSAEVALRGAVEAAEKLAGERIRGVYAAIGGRSLHCRRVGVDLDVEGGRVTREDIADCLRQGTRAAAPEGYRMIHALPIGYSVDGEEMGTDPIGLAGGVLSAEILGVGVRESQIANLESIAERCALRIEEITAAPYAAGEAVLLEDEKELGVVLIDIGAASTDYAVYERGALIDCGGVPVGGDHITRDIAQIFGAPIKFAERVKTLYGSALVGAGDEHKLVDIEQIGEARDIVRVSRAEISAVIAPRLEEIFELVEKRMPADASARHRVRRVVLTGGGSLLVGARETAERVLGLKARLGRPSPLVGAPDAATSPQFSVCAGLIQLAAKNKSGDRAAHGAPTPHFGAIGGGVIASVGQWLRQNF